MRNFLARALVPSPGLCAGVAAFVATLTRPNNPDLLWHLAIGRWIASHGAVPDLGSFYYSGASGYGYDYSWLSQVALFGAYQWLGGAGVAILTSLVAGITFYLLYKLLERHSPNALLNFTVLALALVTTTAYLSGRPAMFTVALLALELVILSRFEESRSRLVWLLPPLTALWVNLHPGFIIAPLLLPAFTPWRGGQRGRMGRMEGVLCALATFAAVMLNPYGWRMYLLPFETVRALPLLAGLSEWNRVSGWEVVVWGVLVALVVWGLARRKQPASVTLIAALAALGAGASSRNLPLFGVVAVFVLARTLLARDITRFADESGLCPKLSRIAAVFRRFELRPAIAGGWVWAVVAPLLAAGAASLRLAPVNLELDLSRYPVGAARYVEANACSGNLFVRETWSGYLLWAAPDRRLFYDAKAGFSPEAVKAHSELVKPGPGWQGVADRYGLSTFLVERGTPLAVVLSEARGWSRAYQDTLAEVFVRRGAQPNSSASPDCVPGPLSLEGQ